MISDEDVVKQAHERFDQASVAWNDQHTRTNEIYKFVAGDQWVDTARQNFENSGYTAVTQNVIPSYLRQITNELRKNTPTIQIDPMDDTTQEAGRKMDDLVRSIQVACKAETAYQQAGTEAATVGVGYLRVRSEYESNDSMNQILCIEFITDGTTVYMDPNHKSVTGSDCEYVFITSAITKDEYSRRYGGSRLDEQIKAKTWTNASKNWAMNDMVVINEYYFKDYTKKKLCLVRFADGNEDTMYEDDIAAEGWIIPDKNGLVDGVPIPQEMMGLVVTIIDSRTVDVPTIRWAKLNDVEVLDQSVWPGEYIPVIAVKGDEYWIDSKRKIVGAVEPAIDAQVMLNYYLSLEAQYIQMAPKAPYIGTASQFKTFEDQWANVNVSNQAFLPYNKDEGAAPPSRDLGEVPIQNLSSLVTMADNAIRQIFGVFDPDQTTVAPESGKAILARQHQAYNSNYHFYDNLARSIQHIGCILVDAIPSFYDTPRKIQTVNQAGEKRVVEFNAPGEDGKVRYDLKSGSYAVSIQTGPSFGTKRQEAALQILDLMQAIPEKAGSLADLAVASMDWPGSKEAAARLRAQVPIEILQAADQEEGADSAEDAGRLKAMVSQLKQELEKTQAAFVEQQKMLDIAQQEMKLERMSKEVDMLKAELDYKLKSRDQDIKEAVTELEFYIKQKEVAMQEQELALKQAQLEVAGIKVASDMNHKDLEAAERQKTLEKKLTDAGTDLGIGIPKLDSDIVPDTSFDNELGNSTNSLDGALS